MTNQRLHPTHERQGNARTQKCHTERPEPAEAAVGSRRLRKDSAWQASDARTIKTNRNVRRVATYSPKYKYAALALQSLLL